MSHHLYGDLSLQSSSSLQTDGLANVQPSRISGSNNINAKFGFSLLVEDDLNFIPYVGAGYNSYSMTFHTDSQPIFNTSANNINLMFGIIPEKSYGNWLKLSLDTNIINAQQELVVPNSLDTLAHCNIQNNYLTTTPAIQFNPFSNFSIEAYYQYVIPLSSNGISDDVENQGYSSATIINSTIGPQDILGLKIGILF